MLKLTPRRTMMLTLGMAAFGLGLPGAVQADNVVSHTQSTTHIGVPHATTHTHTDAVVDPHGKVEGMVIQKTTTVPAQEYQTRRTTTLNPDGSMESRAQASRTAYDAQGNLVTTSKSTMHSSDGAVTEGVTAQSTAIMTPEGDIEVYTRTEPSANGHRIMRGTHHGAWRTGGNFNE